MLVPNIFMRPGTPLGFGMSTADIVFPLTKKICLIGRFDGTGETQGVGRSVVASMNTHTILRAERQIYAANKKFPFIDPSGGILREDHELKAAIRGSKNIEKSGKIAVDIVN